VLLTTWYEFPDVGDLELDWGRLIRIRDSVAKALENLRAADVIGSGLDARVELFADGETLAELQRLGDELRFVFITSAASISPAAGRPADAIEAEDVWIRVAATENEKCTRCWHRRPDVGVVAQHPEICGRCADNIDGAGETRAFA